MSRVTDEAAEQPLPCTAGPAEDRIDVLEARVDTVGAALTIRRALPLRQRRMIGPWCFLDHFGPHEFSRRREGMWVGAHPHIGLQTVTWLMDGEVLHRDSLGTVETIRPGGLNVMTAGRGISHTEESPEGNEGRLHGLQLWLALPERARDTAPAFEHVPQLPRFDDANITGTLFIGEGLGLKASATVHSPLMGADLLLAAPGEHVLPLERHYEHGIVVTEGRIRVGDRDVGPGELVYLAPGRAAVVLETSGPARIGVVGGEPFAEQILLWWNFVGRTPDEIRDAREDWLAGRRFGEVDGFEGDRLSVPELMRLKVR